MMRANRMVLVLASLCLAGVFSGDLRASSDSEAYDGSANTSVRCDTCRRAPAPCSRCVTSRAVTLPGRCDQCTHAARPCNRCRITVSGSAAVVVAPVVNASFETGRFSGRQGAILAEVPFVEGQEPPMAGGGEMWCLVTKPACMKQSSRRVVTRPATFYFAVIPPVFESRSEQMVLEPAKEILATVPAAFRTETVRRLVKEESFRLDVSEPKYEQVCESILVKPAYFEECVIPAQYKTVSETVETAPARIEWRKVDCNEPGVVIQRREPRGVSRSHQGNCTTTCETTCRVETREDCYTTCEVPARCETVSRQVLVSPARTEKREIAAVYENRNVTKMVKPAETRKVVVPAVYEEVCQEVMVTPAVCNTQTIPATFQTVTREVMVKPAGQKRVEVPAKFENVTFDEMVSPAQLVWQKTAGCPEIVKKYECFPGGDAPLAKK